MTTEIFVFGSNLRGAHGRGAAKFARENHGAVYGQGEGLQGQSYAIPTKDWRIQPLPLDAIRVHVRRFLEFAASRPDLTFRVTPVGCGLAGYAPADIGPMFAGSPPNAILPPEFEGLTDRDRPVPPAPGHPPVVGLRRLGSREGRAAAGGGGAMTPEEYASAVVRAWSPDRHDDYVILRERIADAIRAAVEEDRRGRTLDSAEVEAIRDRYARMRQPDREVVWQLLSDRAALLTAARDAQKVMRDFVQERNEAAYLVGYAAGRESIREAVERCYYGPDSLVDLLIALEVEGLGRSDLASPPTPQGERDAT